MKKKEDFENVGGGGGGGGGGEEVSERRKRHAIRYTESDVNALIQLIPLHDGSADAILKIPPFDDGRYTKRQLYDKIRSLERDGRVLEYTRKLQLQQQYQQGGNSQTESNINNQYFQQRQHQQQFQQQQSSFQIQNQQQQQFHQHQHSSPQLLDPSSSSTNNNNTTISTTSISSSSSFIHKHQNHNNNQMDDGYDENLNYSSNGADEEYEEYDDKDDHAEEHHNNKHDKNSIIHSSHGTRASSRAAAATMAAVFASGDSTSSSTYSSDSSSPISSPMRLEEETIVQTTASSSTKNNKFGRFTKKINNNNNNNNNHNNNTQPPQSQHQTPIHQSQPHSPIPKSHQTTPKQQSLGTISPPFSKSKLSSASISGPSSSSLIHAGTGGNGPHLRRMPMSSVSSITTTPSNPLSVNQHVGLGSQSSLHQNITTNQTFNNYIQSLLMRSLSGMGTPFYKFETPKFLFISMPIGPNETIKPSIDDRGNITLEISSPNPWGWLKERYSKNIEIIKDDTVRTAFFPHPGKPYSTPYRIQDIVGPFIGFVFEVGKVEELTVRISDLLSSE